MRYTYQYQPVGYALGFVVTRDTLEKSLYWRKTYGLYRRAGRLRYRNYGREIKNGMSLFDAMQRCTEAAMHKAVV